MVSTDIPLISCGAGKYEFGDKATGIRSATGGQWIDFTINSSDQLGVFDCDFDFPKKPTKLSTFLEFLESQGEINVGLSNHTVRRTEEDGRRIFTVEPDSDALYKLTVLPRPSAQSAMAWIDLQTFKNSPNITLAQGFS